MPQFEHPSQFTPLLPNKEFGELREKSEALATNALQLKRNTNPATSTAIRGLVHIVSSYYSNLIENEAVHPLSISQAMQGDFSEDTCIAQRQRIALAHIKAGQSLEQLSGEKDPTYAALHTSNLVAAHRALYSLLEPPDKTTLDGRIVQSGALRQVEVLVGHHWPPAASSLPAFLRHMDEVYPPLRGLECLPIAVAAAHHRATWLHPFDDGNGRACRLYSDIALRALSGGLWTISRGFARHKKWYFHWLANADLPRQGDLDGRGNLSLKALHVWCAFFLDVADEELELMSDLLNWERLVDRISRVVTFRSWDTPFHEFANEIRQAVIQTLLSGPISSSHFLQLLNIPVHVGMQVQKMLIVEGFLARTAADDVCFRFPFDKLDQLLPQLFPEVTASSA